MDERSLLAGKEANLVSAVVCTRNRGQSVISTVASILESEDCDFEVVVIDQSTDDSTEESIRRFQSDSRVRYFRSAEVGLGRARNSGLRVAKGAVVAFTDDDVTVPPNWLSTMAGVFAEHPQVAVAFCNVAPAPFDENLGFIPAYQRCGSVEVSTVLGKCRARGIGAGLAVRRSALLSLGGFDPLLGSGAKFSSCEDGDVALRALLVGWHVFETDAVSVLHDGFRTWQEGRDLTRRDWYGIGAAYAKPIRAGRLKAGVVVLYEGVWMAAIRPLGALFARRRPQGLRRAVYFWRGFLHGLRLPVDRVTLLFADGASDRLLEG